MIWKAVRSKRVKRIFFAGLALFMACSFIVDNSNMQASAKIQYKKYYNERFDYTIKYPAKFTEASYPKNMDGVERWTKNGEARLTMSGSYSFSGATDVSLVYSIHNCSEKSNYSYRIGKDFIRESYYEGGKNVYDYRFVNKGMILHFVVSYPPEQKSYYKKVVKVMRKSIRNNKY